MTHNWTDFFVIPPAGLTGYTLSGSATFVGSTATNTIPIVFTPDTLSNCNPPVPHITLKKLTNGVDTPLAGDGLAPQLVPGATVTWTYIVTNDGTENLVNVAINDNQLSPSLICTVGNLAIGASATCTKTGTVATLPTGTSVTGVCAGEQNKPLYENKGTATGVGATSSIPVSAEYLSHYCNPPPVCEIQVEKTCEVPVPPPGPFSCSAAKPIDSLTMIWNGQNGVTVKAWKGQVGSTLLATINNVQTGQKVTVNGFAGSPNDVIWEIFDSFNTKIGASTFHLSCSDTDMNGPEDCGKLAGNGKGLTGFLNQWTFDGMAGNGQVLQCTPPTPNPSSSCEVTASPEPSCATEGNHLTSLTFRLTDNDCNITNLQSGKATCSGTFNTSLPVTVKTKMDKTNFQTTVNVGDEFTLPGPKFSADTTITLSNAGGTMTIKIHTSCSQVLEVGDEFGALALVGFNGKRAGTEVIYSYKVTNLGAPVTASGVDDILGPIFSALPLGTGESQTFTMTANISATTENIFTVTATSVGQTGGSCEAEARAVVEVVEPPLPIGACSDLKPIEQMVLEYAGTTAIQNVAFYRTSATGTPSSGDLIGNTGPLTTGAIFSFGNYDAANATNDVDFLITFAGGATQKSRFHLSCSDAEMNDITDCGKLQGNAKDNSVTGGNLWILRDLQGHGKHMCNFP